MHFRQQPFSQLVEAWLLNQYIEMYFIILIFLQAVSLIASYLKVPLRYPLRLGDSHSFIIDYATSIEPTSSDPSSSTELLTSMKHVEFPLFLEGQDITRAAYAVFLLNKVCFLQYVIFGLYYS